MTGCNPELPCRTPANSGSVQLCTVHGAAPEMLEALREIELAMTDLDLLAERLYLKSTRNYDAVDSVRSEVRRRARAAIANALPFKRCACGRAFTRADWEQLEFVGVQETDDEDAHYRTEMRNCPCGSTIAVEVATANDREDAC